MKPKKLTGTIVPQFTYDTPYQAENDFYALCAGESPLVMMFLPNFGHPISRAYITAYIDTLPALTAGRIACVVRSDPARIAESLGGAQLPFPLICDAEGVLYEYFDVRETTSLFDWTFAARRVMKAAKKEGYCPKKGEAQLLPLTLVLGEAGKVIYAHRARSLTDLPEDCEAIQTVCVQLALRLSDAAALEAECKGTESAALEADAVGDIALATDAQQAAADAAGQTPAVDAAAPEQIASTVDTTPEAAPADAAAPEQPAAQPSAIESVQGEVAPKKIAVDWFDAPTK